MKHVAVICSSVEDFNNWKKEQKHTSLISSALKYVFDGTMYIRISKKYQMCGYSFDEIVETRDAANNPEYHQIMDNIKTCIKSKADVK
jgi:hypothetical protein